MGALTNTRRVRIEWGVRPHGDRVLPALLRDLRKILQYGDEREFMQVLRKRGIKDENPRFAELVKLFRDLRGGKT